MEHAPQSADHRGLAVAGGEGAAGGNDDQDAGDTVLGPVGDKLAVEVKGDLAAILALDRNANTRLRGRVHDALLVRVKVVAGARNRQN